MRTKGFCPLLDATYAKSFHYNLENQNSTLSKTHIHIGSCSVPLRSSPLHFLDGRIEVRLGGLLVPWERRKVESWAKYLYLYKNPILRIVEGSPLWGLWGVDSSMLKYLIQTLEF